MPVVEGIVNQHAAWSLPQDGQAGASGQRTAKLDNTQDLERFLAGVERRALRMAEMATNHSDEALDIVQDAMFKLVQRYRNRPAEEWGPLFQRILQSRINDWYRRTAVRQRWRIWLSPRDDADDGDPMATLADEHGRDPLWEVQAGQTLVALEQALQRLPLRQRQVFLLRAWEGLDVAQTAAALGCSAGSVKTHYSRAVHKLREILGEHWPE